MRTFTVEPSRETENYMEMCLGLFYAPSRSIPDDVSNKKRHIFQTRVIHN